MMTADVAGATKLIESSETSWQSLQDIPSAES